MKRPTKNLLIDAAEKYFAEKGYRATSMEDIAGDVGIRPSAIYKHFRNKQDLYEAVLDRMVAPFFEVLESLDSAASTGDSLEALFKYHVANPALARFAIHATLSGGDHRKLLITKWYKPFWDMTSKGKKAKDATQFMAFTNIMLGYVTLAPLHADALGVNPLSDKAIAEEVKVLRLFAETLLKAS
jgi:AcrR family transcriptional regulator